MHSSQDFEQIEEILQNRKLNMGRPPKEDKVTFITPLIIGGAPTIDGNIYPMHVLAQLVERLSLKPQIIIQEMNQVERKLKGISISEPWDAKAMGFITGGKIVSTTLYIECECKNTREGKKLAGLVSTIGVENLDFFPVGYGLKDESGMIAPNYKLSYVAFEPKRQPIRR